MWLDDTTVLVFRTRQEELTTRRAEDETTQDDAMVNLIFCLTLSTEQSLGKTVDG